jgi:hypothetical protein
MGRGTPAKHAPYFEVLEALQHTSACALCDLEVRAQQRYFDSLLYENVNDPGVRRELARSRGYCTRHAHALVSFQDTLGTAILYRDQVELFLAFLAGYTGAPCRRRWSRGKPQKEWVTGLRCPACRRQEELRRTSISIVLTWLHDSELGSAFARAPGPCTPHLLALLDECVEGETRRFLVETQRAKLARLANELDEFRRKSGYGGRHEAFGPERDAWVRAVVLMVGNREVF